MNSKTEVMQTLMMAASESNFFPSAPVIVHQLDRLQRRGSKVDLLVCSFTLTGVALLVSQRCGVPLAGFCLQPTCIPSKQREWVNVTAIDSHGMSLIDDLEAKYFTSHATLRRLKSMFERNPFATWSLPKLRQKFGLPPADTWPTVFREDVPMIIPMKPGTFVRPSDWPDSVRCTDFIFLRSAAPGGGKLAPELQSFNDAARRAGRKLVVMTFSSMPVPRATMLERAVKMLDEGKHPFSLVYVGARQKDEIGAKLEADAARLAAEGRLLELERADFGVLFRQMDAFIVHGGLGTTVEAMRMRKPVAVTGILLMDQRFWGGVVHEKGIGPEPVHIDDFDKICVDFVDKALIASIA